MDSSLILMNKTIVKSSPIHGTGLFAKELIRNGEVVVSWENTREITQSQFSELPEDEKHYVDIQNGKILLVGKPERYVNHSCDPNTMPGELCDIAVRDILKDEEITADYSHFFIPSGFFQCSCGSVSCKEIVRGRSSE